jgi:hypothetical protein
MSFGCRDAAEAALEWRLEWLGKSPGDVVRLNGMDALENCVNRSKEAESKRPCEHPKVTPPKIH